MQCLSSVALGSYCICSFLLDGSLLHRDVVFERRVAGEPPSQLSASHKQMKVNGFCTPIMLDAVLTGCTTLLVGAQEAEAFERDYQRSIGRDVAEAKVASYILKKTRKKVEVLDPTGNAPWFPSQEALEKDWKFGTGKAEPAAIEMLQKKYRQLVRAFACYVSCL